MTNQKNNMKKNCVKLILKKINKYVLLFLVINFVFIINLSILINPSISRDKDFLQVEKSEFEMIEKIMFKRLTYKIQEDAFKWSEDYKREYGEKSFDTLLERFMKTESFMRNSIVAFRFQNSEKAKQMYQEIELLSKLAKEKNSSWKQKLRKSSSTVLQNSRDRAEELKESRYNAEIEYRELKSIIRRHNRLVGDYNKSFMGGLEFINPPDPSTGF